MTIVANPNEYPKYVFHGSGQKQQVADAGAHKLLGPGWYDSPGEAAIGKVEKADPDAPLTKQEKADAKADAKAADAAALAEFTPERDKADAEALYDASVAEVVERIPGTSAVLLKRLRGFEVKNPKHEGGRKGILTAVDDALDALKA
jgi:hypothetical protein